MARKNSRLNKRQLTNAELLSEQTVPQRFCFALLISLDNEFAPGIGKLDRTACPFGKMCGANLLAIDKCHGELVCQPGPKFFQKIERQ